jgi:hypothetical protein
MATAILSMIAFLALIVWRFVFAGLHRRSLARAMAPQQQRHNNLLEEGLHISELGGVVVIAGNRFENSSDDLDRLDRKDRAKTYLRRIVALTGATQMRNGYVLHVGTTRFHVRDRYVRRLRDLTDPKSTYEETCFYPMHKDMPKAEEIATALLQLTNNPALFERWAARNGAFKADGQAFSPAQQSTCDENANQMHVG